MVQLLSQAQEDGLAVRLYGFRRFIRLAWPILEPATPFIDNWHIDCLADHLQAVSDGQLKHLIINVPPGSSKSLITSVMWPAWHWSKCPADRFLTASYTDVLSIRDALKSRRLIQSSWYQEIWGHLFRMTGDQNAKCLTRGTNILMGDGSLRAIETVMPGDKILSIYPRDEKIGQDSVVHAWPSGMQPVRRLTLSDGTVLTATHTHRLYGWDTWKTVGELQVGDPLAVVRRLPPQSNEVTKDDAFLLALWLAEGTKRACSYEVATMDHRIIDRLRQVGHSRGWECRSVGGLRHTLTMRRQQTGKTPMQFLKQFFGCRETYGARSQIRRMSVDDIRLPAEVFSASDEAVNEFLGTYIASDGCIINGKNQGISITSASEGLIRDLAMLVKRFGVKSWIRSQRTRCLDAWSLTIMAKEDVLRLAHLPLFDKTEKLAALVAKCRERTRHQGGRSATIPPNWKVGLKATRHKNGWASRHTVEAFATQHGVKWMQDKLSGDIDWRRIVSIEELGEQETWHLETEQTHTFLANGVYSHNSRYENDKTGYRIATHVGGATGERAKIRVLDDPHNIEEAESDTIRESTISWVRTTWAEREADTKTGGDVVVMQRLHDRDVSGFLIHEVGGYTHVMIPMRFEVSRRFVTNIWKDPRKEEGALLCEARWDEGDVALKEKRLGSYATAGQLQQRPSPELGGILKRHWFRYWQHPGDTYPPVKVKLPDGKYEDIQPINLPWSFERCLASWDMTFKGSTGTDYVVGQQWGKQGADVFLIDQSRDHRDFPDTLEEVRRFHAKHKRFPGQIIIEDKANGPAIIATLKREIPGIIPHPGNDDKVARAHAHSYLVESGNVYLPHPQIAPWVESFIEECCVYDNGAHDDQVIAWSQAMEELYKVEDSGVAITPQYSARFHQSPTSLEPLQQMPSFRFWFQGLYPCCVIGQTLPSGRIMLIDCLLGDQNQSIEDLIDRKVTPTLAADYRGCTDWRDITNHGPISAKSDVSEHHLDSIIRAKLNGNPEPGEPDFFTRLNAITTLLSQTDRLYVNPAPSPGEAKPWIHEALKGGYAYRRDQAGVISKTEPRKFHPLSSVGDAIGHGLSKIFMRKAVPPPKYNKADQQRRAKSYAV